MASLVRLLLALIIVFQPPPRNEGYWVEHIVDTKLQTGLTEEILYDGTRPDIVWQDHAIEVDWCGKWAEGVGQALFYSRVTGKRPTVLLLTREGRSTAVDIKYVSRALIAIPKEGVVWWYDCNQKEWVRGMGPQ